VITSALPGEVVVFPDHGIRIAYRAGDFPYSKASHLPVLVTEHGVPARTD
jgi:hypothetical protein